MIKNIFSAQIPVEVIVQLNRAAEKLYPTLVSDMRLRSILWVAAAIFLLCLTWMCKKEAVVCQKNGASAEAGIGCMISFILGFIAVVILVLNISGVVYPEAALFREILK